MYFYIFCGILDPATVQDCTKFLVDNKCPPTTSERYHRWSMLPELCNTS